MQLLLKIRAFSLGHIWCCHQICNNRNTAGATCGAGTVYPFGALEFTPVFSVVRVARSLVFYVILCRLLFVLLSFFFCSLHCPSFFELRVLITPFGTFKLLLLAQLPLIVRCSWYNIVWYSLSVTWDRSVAFSG